VKYLALVLLVISCTTFDPVARDVCGNGIVEVGEDCDSSEASCVACAVVCTAATDCPTSAYTCGIDARCHAPGGVLHQGQTAGPFAANDYRITDLDRDGIGDVVGASRSSIVVRYGAASGLLDVTQSRLTPVQTGAPAFGHLDGDASLDLAISTPDGLVAYTSPYGALAPLDTEYVITESNGMGTADFRYLFGISRRAFGAFVTEPNSGFVAYVIADQARSTMPTVGFPCGLAIAPADLAPANIDTYQVSADNAPEVDVVVAMLVGSNEAKKLCVLAIRVDYTVVTPPYITVTNITPLNAPTYKQRPLLADLSFDANNGGCPSLIDRDGGPASLRRYDGLMEVTGANVRCGLKPSISPGGDALAPLPVASAQTTLIGRVPLVPALATFARDAIVTSDGLWRYENANQWENIYHSARPWAHVAFADFNRDGTTDVVLSGQGADDLDLLYRVPYAMTPYFELLRLDTASEVTAFTIGDYDGNGAPDIGFTQRLGDHTELAISFVTTDGPQPAVPVAVVSQLVASANVGIPDSADPIDLVGDLVILTPGEPYAGLTVLHGSAQRTMIPYLDPRSAGDRAHTLFKSAVIGAFAPSKASAIDHPDLVGLAVPVDDTTAAPRAWIATGNGVTLDGAPSHGATLSGLATCGTNTAVGGCVEASALLAWPVSATHDVVFTLDRSLAAAATVFDPSDQGADTIAAVPAPGFGPIPKNSIEQALHLADVDGDGVPELVAAFAPASGTSGTGGVLVCPVDATGQPHACVDVVAGAIAAVAPARPVCFDAAPGRFASSSRFATPTAAVDLIVACLEDAGTTLYRVSASAQGFSAEALLHTPTVLGSIQVGDVTGDGIDDVVGLTGTSGTEALVVFAQCSSRDVASCTGARR
jgi:hypothetical protein